MAGKDDSTRHTAAGGVQETSQHEQPRRPQQTMNDDKMHLAQQGDGQERRSCVESRQAPREQGDPQGMLDRSLQAQLGRQLRDIFSSVAEEPVPKRFIDLLDALEAKEKRR